MLASDFPDIRAMLSEYGVGECCNLTSDEIRQAICKLERSEKTYTFSNLTPLSWQAQEKKLLDLYKQCLSTEKR